MKGKIRLFSLCRSAPQVYFAQEKRIYFRCQVLTYLTISAAHSAAAAALPAANVICLLTTISCDSHWDRNENCGDFSGNRKNVYCATLLPEQSIAPKTLFSGAFLKGNSSGPRQVPRPSQTNQSN